MHVCSNCKTKTKQGAYRSNGKFVCVKCENLVEDYFLDRIVFEDGKEPYRQKPFEEDRGREKFIDYIYLLFNQKINPAAYRLMDSYIKKKNYSWLGMVRTMEYFYVAKKNDIKKAKNNIGIIPYVYDEAQKFYEYNSRKNLEKAKSFHKTSKVKTETKVITGKRQRKKEEIDMNTI